MLDTRCWIAGSQQNLAGGARQRFVTLTEPCQRGWQHFVTHTDTCQRWLATLCNTYRHMPAMAGNTLQALHSYACGRRRLIYIS
ncbi:MAG TPA: hypothetical protein PK335_10725 [Draconibacterium sp.]|nr:hypothetical protein [Draconibacterium sp.]